MNRNRKALQVEQLQAEREQTILKLTRLHNTLRSNIDPDTDDGALDLEEQDNALAQLPALERKLEAIDHALQRAQQGTYGLCERCGNPIDPARLEIVPETTFCLACKMIVERPALSKTKAAHY